MSFWRYRTMTTPLVVWPKVVDTLFIPARRVIVENLKTVRVWTPELMAKHLRIDVKRASRILRELKQHNLLNN